mmetsp:Transcript_24502/g.79980  ORF Transcript_24502/g.79980 Transcript_24502/m.79980 type:complete len:204 (+) Transcript_24502:296-907(+)
MDWRERGLLKAAAPPSSPASQLTRRPCEPCEPDGAAGPVRRSDRDVISLPPAPPARADAPAPAAPWPAETARGLMGGGAAGLARSLELPPARGAPPPIDTVGARDARTREASREADAPLPEPARAPASPRHAAPPPPAAARTRCQSDATVACDPVPPCVVAFDAPPLAGPAPLAAAPPAPAPSPPSSFVGIAGVALKRVSSAW